VSRSAEAVKAATDRLAAALALLVLAPLLLAVALAVRLDVGRPVLFRQRRPGRFGEPFLLLKFRTMRLGNGPDGERLTRLGRFLRASSLDELPELVNVVRGEMSLVGPRPLVLYEASQIKGSQRRRLAMRPGLSGLWQVNGRNMVDFDEWVRMDLEYIDRWSLGLDLRILLKTIPVVLSGTGAR